MRGGYCYFAGENVPRTEARDGHRDRYLWRCWFSLKLIETPVAEVTTLVRGDK